MKKILLLIAILLALGFSGIEAYTFWKEGMAKAVASAVTLEKSKQKLQISNLKGKHFNEIKRLKQKHRNDVAKVKTKERAKAKVQRAVLAVPVMGVAAFGLFETIEFENWKKENPNGTVEKYTVELGSAVNELLQDEYQEYSQEYEKLLSIWEE